MKFSVLALLILAWIIPASATSYTTNFPVTENPLSDGGKWTNGGTAGIDWSDVQTTPGKATGLEPGTGNAADSTAVVLAGTWGANQSAQATVFVTGSPSRSCGQEVELRLRTTITAHSITGYEISYSSAFGSFNIVRWNGALNNFTVLKNLAGNIAVNGDVLSATISGSTISAYRNGVLITTVTDSTYVSGSPGIGLNYTQNTGNGCVGSTDRALYGFSSFTATDGSGGSGGPFTILSQQPVTNRPYPVAYYNQRLPNAGSGGPLTHLMPNSDSMMAAIMQSGAATDAGAWNSPGSDDGQHKPLYYGQASDPVYQLAGCVSPETALNGIKFHAPSGAQFNQGSFDKEILFWDQTTNQTVGLFGGTCTSANCFALPACSGTLSAPCSFTVNGGYCSADNWVSGSGVGGGDAISTAGLSPFGNIIRLTEVTTIHHINHGLRLVDLCSGTDSGLYGTRVVFPANQTGGTGANPCTATGTAEPRPPNGALIFADYTQAQLDCFDPSKTSCSGVNKLTATQFALVEAMTLYGGTTEDTGGGESIRVPGIESEQAYYFYNSRGYSGSLAVAQAFESYMGSQCVSPWCSITTRSSPHSVLQWNLTWAGISNQGGKSFWQHLHIADQCVAIGLQGLSSVNGVAACASVAPPSGHLSPATSSSNLGSQTVGVVGPQVTVGTFTNDGSTNVTLSTITLASGVNYEFAGTGTCSPGQVITPGGSCSSILKFFPQAAGVLTDTLTITSDATDTVTVALSGTGTAPLTPVLDPISPLAFGNQNINTTSVSQNYHISNSTGTAPLSVSALVIAGPFAAASNGTCGAVPFNVAAGAFCDIPIVFQPLALGPLSGSITLTHNAAGSPTVTTLSGTGTQPGASLTASISFGNVALNVPSSSQPAVLTNTGTGPLTVNAPTITAPFSQTNSCGTFPITLAPSASCTFNVVCTPNVSGVINGQLQVTDNAPSPTQITALSCNGVAPATNGIKVNGGVLISGGVRLLQPGP